MNSSSRMFAIAALFLASACAGRTKAARPQVLALRSVQDAVQVMADDEIFARVALSPVEPPSVVALFAHGGRHLLRGFPLNPRDGESVDHPEHLSLWTAHASVSGHDLWSDATGPRLTRHSLRMQAGGRAVVDMELEWRAPNGTTLCGENRSYRFQATDEIRTVDVEHVLTATGGGTVFGDVREGFFALRLQDDLRPDAGARVLTSLKVEGQDPFGLPARWIAYSALLANATGEEKPVTICIFDHPDNPGYPTRWFARSYGIVAANPFASSAFDPSESITRIGRPEGFRIESYKSTTLLYRVAIASAELDAQQIEELWSEFAGQGDPE
ncbi:MAG: PmoA family protein [Planctomycetota bacterium]